MLFWAYRTLGPHLPSPSLAAVWLIAHLNAMLRTDERRSARSGRSGQGKMPFEIGTELFRRILAHPEGVEIARRGPRPISTITSGSTDGRIRLAPEPHDAPRCGARSRPPPAHDPEFPFVLAAGLRTRWTANTIQRDPAWRKGRGPHCALNLSPRRRDERSACATATRCASPRAAAA